jgi:hypothetical protein
MNVSKKFPRLPVKFCVAVALSGTRLDEVVLGVDVVGVVLVGDGHQELVACPWVDFMNPYFGRKYFPCILRLLCCIIQKPRKQFSYKKWIK